MVNISPPLLRFSHSSLKHLSESSILRSFDLIIHAHSVYLYFLDNSTVRLILRFIFQINILSPRSPLPAFAGIDLPIRRDAILLLFAFAIGCIPHLFFGGPSAGESTQGYLHGGLLIDFIGQRGSVSRLRLVILDIVILVLQSTMLSLKATTAYPPEHPRQQPTRVIASTELDRAERGETDEVAQPDEPEEESSTVCHDLGYEHITIRVGVVETIKSLWGNENPIVRRFQ